MEPDDTQQGIAAAEKEMKARNARFAAETKALKRAAQKLDAGLKAYGKGDAAAAAADIDAGLKLLSAAIRGQRAWRDADANLPAIGRFVRALRELSDFEACPRNDVYWAASFGVQSLQINAEIYIYDYGRCGDRRYNPGMGDAWKRSSKRR